MVGENRRREHFHSKFAREMRGVNMFMARKEEPVHVDAHPTLEFFGGKHSQIEIAVGAQLAPESPCWSFFLGQQVPLGVQSGFQKPVVREKGADLAIPVAVPVFFLSRLFFFSARRPCETKREFDSRLSVSVCVVSVCLSDCVCSVRGVRCVRCARRVQCMYEL